MLAMMVSVELLLKEWRVLTEPEKIHKKEELYKLIKEYEFWGQAEKEDIDWLRKRGNAIKHRGEEQEQELQKVSELIEGIYPLIGSLYEKLDHKIDQNYSIYGRCLLKGKNRPWYALADSYSAAALRYAYFDEEIAVDLANEAYETALR